MTVVRLQTDALLLECVPAVGCTVTRFAGRRDDRWLDLMRAAPLPLERSSFGSSFPLAPYSNRIRDGRFSFEGETHQLGRAEKHAIHGDVRDRPWSIVERAPDTASFEIATDAFDDFDFPFPFRARQRFRLDGHTLEMRLEIENAGDRPMPAGGGFHPYFNRALGAADENTELEVSVSGVYPAGDPPLPTGPAVDVPAEWKLSPRRPLDIALDHCFAGWTGAARVFWPTSGLSLEMSGNEPLGHLVVYSPPGQPFFALEPVSHVNDGFNLLERGIEGTGVRRLAPEESLLLEARFQVREA